VGIKFTEEHRCTSSFSSQINLQRNETCRPGRDHW